MTDKPRIHHFVPQFWIRKFISLDGKLWGYEWNSDRIRDRSPRSMMQVFDLYTIQPSGADDTSLETNELGVIDTAGARAFDLVLTCSIPDDHIDPRRSALFMARSVLREARDGDRTC